MEKPVLQYIFRVLFRLFQRLPAVYWHPGSDPSLFHRRWLPKVESLGRQRPGSRGGKEASTWDEPLARAPPQVAPRLLWAPGTTAPAVNHGPACDDSWTDLSGYHPKVSHFQSHPAMSHVALSQVSSSSSIVNQPRRLIRGSTEAYERLYMRVRYINLPLAAFVLPNSPDISPSLVPPCPVLLCLPRLSLPPGPPFASSVDPAEWPTASQVATLPLACLQMLTRANTHDGIRLTISLQ